MSSQASLKITDPEMNKASLRLNSANFRSTTTQHLLWSTLFQCVFEEGSRRWSTVPVEQHAEVCLCRPRKGARLNLVRPSFRYIQLSVGTS